MWYLGAGGPPGRYQSSICYASSRDGLRWNRGDFDHVTYPGAPRNNLVFRDERAPEVRRTHPMTVLLDAAEPDPARRFKFVAF